MASDRLQRQIERLLDEADQAITGEDWPTVSSRARSVLAIDPENAEGLAYLAAADRALGGSAPQPPTHSTTPPPVAAPTPEPTSFSNGRYQVKRFLGEGGKKKVYLAHDTTLDREVAFALIKTDGLDETSRTRIQREAQAMGRLGSHAHIVTVFDLGEEQDQPYMVTELMGGGDVEGVIEDAPDHRLPLEQAIKIAQETCRGMEFAHGRGIVHRDLKPGNVWLTSDGIAKIGDFGLAVALDRSRLTTEGMMVGTVSYMPPEQAMGGEVTPRSDLYSLGAMLYEMVTGRPPFLGDDSVAIIGQHINTPPVAPTWHNGQCPRALDALILRLLAKDPNERPESATDVLSALDGIDVQDVGASFGGRTPLPDDETHALDSLAGGVFVGRQREMGDLKAALEDALSGRGRLVTLVGEPGIGKSRTAQELTTYAGLRGAQVLWGRSYEEQGVPPYWPWVQAIRSYVREKDPQQLQSEMGSGAADIAEVVSDVRDRLPGLPPATQLEPEQARFRLFDSITSLLKTASHSQPLVLVLDDLHWADQPSLALLQFVARELSGARLLIIGTYRDMGLSRQHPLAEALGELTRERLFQRVLLRGLTQEDVGRFIEMTSGHAAPRGLVEAVHTQTEGNPLFVTEVVRLLAQEGELGADPSTGAGRAGETDSWTIRIPEGVREVIGRRLNRLSQRCNEALTVASILGREFTLAQLRPQVEEVTEDRLFEILEEALAARVIEELPQSVGSYQFTHALIQETLSGELSTTRKVRLHARIAQELEELYGIEVEAHSAELAHHFAESEALLGPEKLVHYSLVAGERALAGYAHEDAMFHFHRGLAASDGRSMDTQTADLLYGLGRSQAATLDSHRLGEAVGNLSRAFDYYVEIGELDVAVAIAENPVSATFGHRTGMAQLIGRALVLVPPDSHTAGRLLSHYVRVIGAEEGDDKAAQEALGRALAIAQREGDAALELRTLASGCSLDVLHLRPEEGLVKALRAIELAGRVDAPLAEVAARYYAGISLFTLGDLEEARRQAAAALALAETLRDRFWLGMAFAINGIVSMMEGDFQAARDFSDRGLAVAPSRSILLTVRTALEYHSGGLDEGAIYLERLLEAMRLVPSGPTFEYAAVALVTGAADHREVAESAAGAVLSSPSAGLSFIMWARAGLAMVAVHRGDALAAEEQRAALGSQPGVMLLFTVCDRLLGLLSMTLGNLNQAMVHFEDALTFCRKAGYRPELAWTCCDYADMLKERDAEGDRAKAIALLDESLAISSDLGMRPLMERVLSRREILRA